MYLKENIKTLRKKNKWSMELLAQKVGLKYRSQINGYETGYAMPKIETLILLAEIFKVSIDDLLKKKL